MWGTYKIHLGSSGYRFRWSEERSYELAEGKTKKHGRRCRSTSPLAHAHQGTTGGDSELHEGFHTRDRAASHTGSSTCWAPGQAARARTHCDSMPTADSLNSHPALVQSCLMILSQHWEARQNYINDGRLTFFGSTFNKDVLFLCHSKVAPKHSLVCYIPRYSINDIFILMVTCSYLPLLLS